MAGGFESLVDVVVRVGGGDEESFVLGRREQDAAFEHLLEEGCELCGVGLFGCSVVGDVGC